jgi:hypothetical protein
VPLEAQNKACICAKCVPGQLPVSPPSGP